MIHETRNEQEEDEYDWENFKIVETVDFNSQQMVFLNDKQIDEERYKINPQNAIVLDALKVQSASFAKESHDKQKSK